MTWFFSCWTVSFRCLFHCFWFFTHLLWSICLDSFSDFHFFLFSFQRLLGLFLVGQILFVPLLLSDPISFSALWKIPSICLTFLFLSFYPVIRWNGNIHVTFFLWCNISSGLLNGIGWFSCLSKSQIVQSTGAVAYIDCLSAEG